jgi:dipeptidyl aminopeptidase/acylaminoacyl peptidase
MKKLLLTAATAALMLSSCTKTQETVNIGKSDIKLESNQMTPEALWAMGRIATAEASPNGKQIVYQVGYYSVEENKGHHVLCLINADGTDNRQLTESAKSETDPAWIEDGKRIAYISDGQIWAMNADGTNRTQLTNDEAGINAFKFSPDGKKVILLKSIPFNEIIKKNPDDLPKATGINATDLMYRHWDHYVQSIQHPFVAEVTENGISQGYDIMEG